MVLKNKSRSVRAAAVVAAVLSGILFTGCGVLGLSGLFSSKPTAVSLTKAAWENVQKAESASIHMDLNTDLAMTYETLNLSVNAGLDIGLDMDMTKDPELARGTADIAAEVIGQKQSLQGEFYVDPAEGSDGTTYIRWNGGKWQKKASKAKEPDAGSSQSGDSPDSAPASNDSAVQPENLLQGIGLIKMVSEQALDAELLEETVTVEGQEAWQINTVLKGPLLKEILQNSGSSKSFDMDKINWDDLEIPSKIFIYKEDELPARIILDCTAVGTTIVGEILKDQIPLDSLKMDISSCTLDATFTNYNKIDPFEIPQEARNAETVDDLMPGLTNFLTGGS